MNSGLVVKEFWLPVDVGHVKEVTDRLPVYPEHSWRDRTAPENGPVALACTHYSTTPDQPTLASQRTIVFPDGLHLVEVQGTPQLRGPVVVLLGKVAPPALVAPRVLQLEETVTLATKGPSQCSKTIT